MNFSVWHTEKQLRQTPYKSGYYDESRSDLGGCYVVFRWGCSPAGRRQSNHGSGCEAADQYRQRQFDECGHAAPH